MEAQEVFSHVKRTRGPFSKKRYPALAFLTKGQGHTFIYAHILKQQASAVTACLELHARSAPMEDYHEPLRKIIFNYFRLYASAPGANHRSYDGALDAWSFKTLEPQSVDAFVERISYYTLRTIGGLEALDHGGELPVSWWDDIASGFSETLRFAKTVRYAREDFESWLLKQK